jgi:hypothetical protein
LTLLIVVSTTGTNLFFNVFIFLPCKVLSILVRHKVDAQDIFRTCLVMYNVSIPGYRFCFQTIILQMFFIFSNLFNCVHGARWTVVLM